MAEKMRPVDAVRKIFETLTGQPVDQRGMFFSGEIVWPAECCLKKGNWLGLSAELEISLSGVNHLRIYCPRDERGQSSTNNKGYVFLIDVSNSQDNTPAYLANDPGSDQRFYLGHPSTVVCLQVLLLYHQLVNGFSDTPSVVTRDEQVRAELASSAKTVDRGPDFANHRTC